VFGCEVFSNAESLSLEDAEKKIRACLIDGEFFDPTTWKVKRLKNDDWIPEFDHTWNEFESLEFTDDTPTNSLSFNKFLNLIIDTPKY
jgi:hypothetical protein